MYIIHISVLFCSFVRSFIPRAHTTRSISHPRSQPTHNYPSKFTSIHSSHPIPSIPFDSIPYGNHSPKYYSVRFVSCLNASLIPRLSLSHFHLNIILFCLCSRTVTVILSVVSRISISYVNLMVF